MDDMPKISIVTPSFNQGQFLERTIVSVLNQEYPNLEYFVIDGGSTDGSVEIIKKYEKYLTHWVSEPDDGQSDAICKGFSKSTGEILAWLNSDDMYLPGALFNIADAFRKNPDAALVYGDYIKVDASDRCFALRRKPSFDYRIVLYRCAIPIQPASFFNRRAFFEVGGIDTSFHYTMDYDLILRLARYGNIGHIGKYLAAMRFHPACKSMAEKGKFAQEGYRALLKNLQHAPSPTELRLLHCYHMVRLAIRMLREGCIASRYGKCEGDYKLKGFYTPRFNGLEEEA